MLMRLNPASRHAAAFSGEMVSGSASSVTSSNCARERSANRVDNLREAVRVQEGWAFRRRNKRCRRRHPGHPLFHFPGAGGEIRRSRGKPRGHTARTVPLKTRRYGSCSRCTSSGRTELARICRVASFAVEFSTGASIGARSAKVAQALLPVRFCRPLAELPMNITYSKPAQARVPVRTLGQRRSRSYAVERKPRLRRGQPAIDVLDIFHALIVQPIFEGFTPCLA